MSKIACAQRFVDWVPLASPDRDTSHLLDFFSLVFAIAVPVLVLYVRQEVRLRRLRQIKDFLDNFRLDKLSNSRLAVNPTFEFARSKYTADLQLTAKERDSLRTKTKEPEIVDLLIQVAERGRSHFSGRLYMSALFFVFICFMGFSLLHRELACKLICSANCLQPSKAENFLIIALLTFVGAYISSIRLLMNRLALFDISSNTFLRVSGETLASIAVSAILYAALSGPLAALVGSAPANPAATSIPPLWLALAVTLGLIPESATRFLLSKIQSRISFIKTTDDRYNDVSKVTSPEVIDGIDYEARFRLQDCGIYDVQNLATYNPILLYIETPYGIYQCIDWIAQAQLCNIVGLERFMIFRELNVRTIFDLERAIDSEHSPRQFDEIYLSVLLAPTMRLRQAAEIGNARFTTYPDGTPKFSNVEDFCTWCLTTVSKDPATLSRAAEHLLDWMTDDLHVRRLRRLMNEISESLGVKADYLPDSKRRARRTREPRPDTFADGAGI